MTSAREPPNWGTPSEEYRQLARDCVAMKRPDLALQFLALAEQEQRQAQAMAALFDVRRAS